MSLLRRIRKKIDSGRIIGWTASVLVILSALHILANSIYPLIFKLQDPSAAVLKLKFDLRLLMQALAAYILLISGIALSSRSRLVWSIALLSLAYLLVDNILLRGYQHIDLFLVVSLIFILISYRYFSQQLYLTYSFVFISGFIIFALFYGVLGSYFLRNEFHNLHTINDALYFSVITYSTVGYGDIYPLTTTAKYFVISMVLIGLIMFTSGITLIAYLFNNKIKNLMFNFNKGKTAMTNHMVLCGYGIMAKILIQRYRKEGIPFLVIDNLTNNNLELEQLKAENSLLIAPYPGCTDTFVRGRLNEAKIIIISFDSDADTILAIMNICEFLEQFPQRPQIIARIFYQENVQKAVKAGADSVIATHQLVADAISALSH